MSYGGGARRPLPCETRYSTVFDAGVPEVEGWCRNALGYAGQAVDPVATSIRRGRAVHLHGARQGLPFGPRFQTRCYVTGSECSAIKACRQLRTCCSRIQEQEARSSGCRASLSGTENAMASVSQHDMRPCYRTQKQPVQLFFAPKRRDTVCFKLLLQYSVVCSFPHSNFVCVTPTVA